MNTNYKKLFSIIKLVYEIKDEKIITILDSDFVNNNKNNCKMIVDNKIYLLSDKYQIFDEKMKLLKIKLLVLNNKKIDLSFMFYNCKSLKEFKLVSKFEEIIKEDNKKEYHNNQSKNKLIDNSVDANTQSDLTSKNNGNDINHLLNQAIKIYYMYNDFDRNNDLEKLNNIINLSNDYITPSLNSIEYKNKNNNCIEYNLFNENSLSLNNWKNIRLNNDSLNLYKVYKNIEKDKIIATDLSYMFFGCSSLLSITGLSKINTSNVKYLNHMFLKFLH